MLELAGVLTGGALVAWISWLRFGLAKARLEIRKGERAHALELMKHEQGMIEQAHRHQLELSTDREVVLSKHQADIARATATAEEAKVKAADARAREASYVRRY